MLVLFLRSCLWVCATAHIKLVEELSNKRIHLVLSVATWRHLQLDCPDITGARGSRIRFDNGMVIGELRQRFPATKNTSPRPGPDQDHKN